MKSLNIQIILCFGHQTTLDPGTSLHILHTKRTAMNNSIIIAHTNWVYFHTSFDQAAEQAEAVGIDHANEFEN